MNVKKEISMNWDEAPDTITPEIYAEVRGHSLQWAREQFNKKDFPKLDSGKLIADKTAVRLYEVGINMKNNPKLGIDYLIYLELKKINERREQL